MNMKKYILLIGFVMASVDCSAGEDNLPGLHIPGTLIKSLLAAAQSYVPSVMALLAAIKGQSSQPTADQSAPAGGGGAVEINVSGFNIGITQDLMNRLKLRHDDLTKKISESNKKHVAFLRTISSERPDLQTLINSYEESGDVLLVAMQGLLTATGEEKNNAFGESVQSVDYACFFSWSNLLFLQCSDCNVNTQDSNLVH